MAFLVVDNSFQLFLVVAINIANVRQPTLQGVVVILIGEGSFHTAAIVMTANDDMFHLQVVHGVLQDGSQVEIGIDNHVRHIAVNKQLTRATVDHVLRSHTRIGAADPKIFRGLPRSALREEVGIFSQNALSPSGVPLTEFGDKLLIDICGHVFAGQSILVEGFGADPGVEQRLLAFGVWLLVAWLGEGPCAACQTRAGEGLRLGRQEATSGGPKRKSHLALTRRRVTEQSCLLGTPRTHSHVPRGGGGP
mmetsp:Transcript_32306/g.48742  ORF Transcript_32306/g.48742 Transcript_32306/m.48742 type:complete len:250 (+) Transcript_32306:829-1578(+)